MKLIFLDIDGTLVEPGTNVPPQSAMDAIHKAQEAGNKVFLCSGRNYDMLKPLLKYGFDGYIASAGGYIVAEDKLLYSEPMDKREFREILDLLHQNGVFCTVEAKDATYGDENLAEILGNAAAGNSEIERWRKALAEELNIKPLKEFDGRPVYKIVIMCETMDQLAEAIRLYGDRYEFCVQEVFSRGGIINGELINRKYDKGRGVLRVADFYGVSVRNTIGFGDSMNDVTMIDTVGTGVCMENGSAELKKHSDVVVPAVKDDGLYKGFEMLKLM